jgi:hypothetical protein
LIEMMMEDTKDVDGTLLCCAYCGGGMNETRKWCICCGIGEKKNSKRPRPPKEYPREVWVEDREGDEGGDFDDNGFLKTPEHKLLLNERRLNNLTPEQLERQANLLLYGTDTLVELDNLDSLSWRFYTPSQKPIIYVKPKYTIDFGMILTCKMCGKERSRFSAGHCSECYRTMARDKYVESRDGMDDLRGGGTATNYKTGTVDLVVMPQTEWWDDTDIPAQSWNRANRKFRNDGGRMSNKRKDR